MAEYILRFFGFGKTPVSKGVSSEFSRFFREASSGEKKKVFLDVAKKASADQRKILEKV